MLYFVDRFDAIFSKPKSLLEETYLRTFTQFVSPISKVIRVLTFSALG